MIREGYCEATMKAKRKPYSAYLLRLWHTQEVRDAWRVSLEDAETRELRGFASLEDVFAFLRREVEGEATSEEMDAKPKGGEL